MDMYFISGMEADTSLGLADPLPKHLAREGSGISRILVLYQKFISAHNEYNYGFPFPWV